MHAQIRAAIQANPQLRQLIEAGDDEQAAVVLSQVLPKQPTGELYTERSMFAELGPAMAESILATLGAWSASNESDAADIIERALSWLQPESGGIDFQHQEVQAMLTGLQVAGVLSVQQLSALQQLGLRPVAVTHHQVAEAVAIWRPNGLSQQIPE